MRRSVLVCIVLFALSGGVSAYGYASAEEYVLRYIDETDGLSHNHITRVLQDERGMIWISTWNGLNRYDGSRFVCFTSEPGDGVWMPSDRIRNIELREDGNLLCLVEDRLILFNTHTCQYESLDSLTEATEIAKMYQEHFLVTQVKNNHTTEKILGKDTLHGIGRDYRDHQGNRWLVDGNGIYIASKVQRRGQLLTQKEARAMCVMSDGTVCYAERGLGVYSIFEDSKGSLLLGKKPGCVVKGSRTAVGDWQTSRIRFGEEEMSLQRLIRHHTNTKPILTDNVYEMVEDSVGRIWMASFGGGIVCGEQVYGQGLQVRRLQLLHNGRMYAATSSGLGMIDNIYAAAPRFYLYQRNPEQANSLCSNAVMDIAALSDRLYVATAGGGLDVTDISAQATPPAESPIFTHLTTREGLGSDAVYQLSVRNDSVLLIQENNGISMLQTRTKEIVNYGSSFFGMPMHMGEVRPIRWHEDTWLLATSNGILAIPDSDFQAVASPTRIAIRSVKTNAKETDYTADWQDTIVLSPNERSVSIGFSALDYRTDARILYRTKWTREGTASSVWTEPSSTDEVIFQDLQPGHYILEIEATNGFGQWIGTHRVLHIEVQPTFWESLLGRIVRYGIIVVLIVVLTSIFLRMWDLSRKKEELFQAYLRLQEQVTAIKKQESVHAPQLVAPGLSSADERFLEQLRTFVDSHIDDSETMVDDMAEAMGMSRSSLTQRMHKLFNVSPADFLREARLRHACTLLRTTDMTGKEIAYACGFNDPKYFAKCFKNAMGKTPTEWKNEQKEG
ncbi:MAG: helix-turn-helix domain-containing protein [Paludibacteraceae bacterium]